MRKEILCSPSTEEVNSSTSHCPSISPALQEEFFVEQHYSFSGVEVDNITLDGSPLTARQNTELTNMRTK